MTTGFAAGPFVAGVLAQWLPPIAPWVFGTAAIAFAYLPALVAERGGSHALLFSAAATTLTAVTGILAQPLAKLFTDRTARGHRGTDGHGRNGADRKAAHAGRAHRCARRRGLPRRERTELRGNDDRQSPGSE
ncbi:MAG TPA: hypothetical protein VGM60_03790 [Pseudonocardia sp.]|jgi:hypothetical protein|uniref:hypothetical protein n=1 Tax=Pseudonocardia sp. TaxID=60912 RepID=UPI002F423000